MSTTTTRRYWHLLVLLVLVPVAATARADTCVARSGSHVVPLVELYTAEGCSDCPPADAWLSKLAAGTGPSQGSMLAFHVDYWDDIGWPDPFADPAYSQRQEFRVKLAKKKVIYTPHVMIGAETTVQWDDPGQTRRLLSRTRARQPQVELAMEAVRVGDDLRVAVRALPKQQAAAGPTPDLMWLALYQDGLVRKILEGENKGKTLHHDRVTRVLKGPWGISGQPVAGEVTIPLEAGADLSRHGLVLFAESSTTGEGLQSLSLPLGSCGL